MTNEGKMTKVGSWCEKFFRKYKVKRKSKARK